MKSLTFLPVELNPVSFNVCMRTPHTLADGSQLGHQKDKSLHSSHCLLL